MSESLSTIVQTVRSYPGIVRKQPIKAVFERLKDTQRYGDPLPNYGDDAAVIPYGDEYLLLACDGMMTGLLVNEPYAAGKASIMVTVNDIYAMGGRPIGLVNVLASGDENQRSAIVQGIEKGCRKLEVPMLGGHLHPDAPVMQPSLSVTILGRARCLLRSHLAETGDALIVAVDLDGSAGCKSVVSWDANSGKTSQALKNRLEAMPTIAEAGLSRAAKDISNAGMLGTAAIMMENSNRGAQIDLEALPKPSQLTLTQWLLCFQSYGFVLTCPLDAASAVLKTFHERHVTAAVVGRVTENPRMILKQGEKSAVLFDFSCEGITGIRRPVSDQKRHLLGQGGVFGLWQF